MTQPPTPAPSAHRALLGLLVNLVVLPGLGTIVSGDLKRRRVGYIQLGLGALMVPLIALLAHGGWAPSGMSAETLRQWLSNTMIALAIWAAFTSALTLRDAWRADRGR